MDMKAIGDRFYMERVSRRMTMRKLSALSGVSRDAISRLEKGESVRIGLDVLLKLGRVLDVQMSDIESLCNEGDGGGAIGSRPGDNRHE